MSFNTFSPAKAPTADQFQQMMTPRLLTADFGDGYKQTTLDGINSVPYSLSVVWMNIPKSDAASIEAFLFSNAGVPFWYTPPGWTSAALWDWSNYQRTQGATVDNVQVMFNQRFDQY